MLETCAVFLQKGSCTKEAAKGRRDYPQRGSRLKHFIEKLFLEKQYQEIKKGRLSSAAMLLELSHQLVPRVTTGHSQTL